MQLLHGVWMETLWFWGILSISVTWICVNPCGASVSSRFYIYTDETLPGHFRLFAMSILVNTCTQTRVKVMTN